LVEEVYLEEDVAFPAGLLKINQDKTKN